MACKMRHRAGEVVKLPPAMLRAKNLEIESFNINTSIGIVSEAIIDFINGRSYEIQLKNCLYESVGSKVFK